MGLALVGMARCAVPARVVAGGMKYSSDIAIRKSCAAALGADIAARCPARCPSVPAGGLAKFNSSWNRRSPGVGVCFVPPHANPHPNPLPQGEGERWHRIEKFGRCGCSHRFCVFRFGGTRQSSSVRIIKARANVSPSPWERAGVRGNRTSANLAASVLNSAPENLPKGTWF